MRGGSRRRQSRAEAGDRYAVPDERAAWLRAPPRRFPRQHLLLRRLGSVLLRSRRHSCVHFLGPALIGAIGGGLDEPNLLGDVAPLLPENGPDHEDIGS